MADPSTDGSLNQLLRRLPKVDEVMKGEAAARLLERAPRWAVVAAVRDEIEALRARVLDEKSPTVDVAIAGDRLATRVDEMLRPSLVRVLNATGVVLHTNLGRAPLAEHAALRVAEIARGYSNLEYRLDERRRGSRHEHVAGILSSLTGAEGALVVNNNAAAVLLALGGLAAGREVIVSRGELVEIGGSFRIPDVMRASGAKLVEVGTTNRTHRRDYERAIGPDTALLLKVHQSNFAQVGFTAEVTVEELVEIGRARKLPVMVDLGSGSLVAMRSLGLGPEADEPTAQALVAAGADVVTCSGDKLLGGPQAGIVLGRAAVVGELRQQPLLRALRPDKMTLAALEATLELYRDGRPGAIPALAMLATPRDLLRARAEKLAQAIRARAPRLACDVLEARSAVGGGALPRAEPPSFAVAVAHPTLSAEAIDARLRACDPPLVARIADGKLLADVRTLRDDELDLAAAAFASLEET